ncbi:melanoma-associated antigen 10-like [Dipodomys merriami]|uniref:melanoma-associated antigen 10-like n=1 Tax=Dipodomys merriami TaxID=94247 RepID=UPI003855D428
MSEGLRGEVVRETHEEHQGCSDQAREDLCLHDNKILYMALQNEAIALVPYLLHKYWLKASDSDRDILKHITVGHQHYFPLILDKASLFMELMFGIDIKQVGPILHTHVLAITAGITYDGVLSDMPGMPKSGMLILMLCIISIEGDYATENTIWKVLSKMEVYPDREHFIYGKHRKLLMEDFVWEQYVAYKQVPCSDPIVYKFMWGPRAYEETTKRKVLKHWAKFREVDPRCFASLYKEAL